MWGQQRCYWVAKISISLLQETSPCKMIRYFLICSLNHFWCIIHISELIGSPGRFWATNWRNTKLSKPWEKQSTAGRGLLARDVEGREGGGEGSRYWWRHWIWLQSITQSFSCWYFLQVRSKDSQKVPPKFSRVFKICIEAQASREKIVKGRKSRRNSVKTICQKTFC